VAGHRVVVIGGGIAGLTAAHELCLRGFSVDVYERREILGGKARSFQYVRDEYVFPAEHGFRFFPRFYRHVTDTMKRIEVRRYPHSKPESIADNLVECSEGLLARNGKSGFKFGTWFPRTIAEWRALIHRAATAAGGLDLEEEHLRFFVRRVWQLMTSCDSREANDYERIGWWEYLEASNRGPVYQDFLVAGITRNLIAANPRTASARVGGKIFAELMFGLMRPGVSSDRVLNGPTSQKWIDPWANYLIDRGVRFHMGASAVRLNCNEDEIESVTIAQKSGETTVNADFYVLAIPVERAAKLITPALTAIDPTLKVIKRLARDAKKMVGVQFYVDRELDIAKGHVSFVDSRWALTAISQAQFWDIDLLEYGGGWLRDVLSVDISDWDKPGSLYGIVDGKQWRNKKASECTDDEIAVEVWEQMKLALNVDGQEVLHDKDLLGWYVCGNCVTGDDDEDRLLVNMRNSWWYRPEAYTRIPNLFLASDYVRTNTSLATMEAANEAARRAVNAIIDKALERPIHAGLKLRSHCRIWSLSAPWVLKPFRTRDSVRYAAGQPWDERNPPGWTGLAYRLAVQLASALIRNGQRNEETNPNSKLNIRRRAKARRETKYAAAQPSMAAPSPPAELAPPSPRDPGEVPMTPAPP